jgi:hypothetical protein
MTTLSVTPTFPPLGSVSFNADAYAWAQHMAGTFTTQLNAIQGEVGANATVATTKAGEALASAGDSAASAVSAQANAQAAAASAGATVWVSGVYALNQRVIAPANQRLYVCKTAGSRTIDPSADPANWGPIDTSAVVIPVAGTTATVYAGAMYSLNNAAATAATLDPAIADGGEFGLILKNGRADNTLDIGTKTLYGTNGQAITGVIAFDTQIRTWTFKYTAATTSLEMI